MRDEFPITQPYPSVSVIVPHFGNDLADLRRCLACLKAQTYPHSQFQIIVVDNASTPCLALADMGGAKDVVVVHEPLPGSYAARNRGVVASTGQIIAFTDADCLPAPDWLYHAVGTLISHRYGVVVGGALRFTFSALCRPNAFELFDSVFHLRQEFYVKVKHFAATANMVTPRAHFDRVGLFNPFFYSGGDQEWVLRLKSNSIPVVFADDVIVEHPARASLSQVLRKNCRGVGAELARTRIERSSRLRVLGAQFRLCKARTHLLWQVFRSRSYTRTEQVKIGVLFLVIHLTRWCEAIRLILGGRPLR